MPAVATEDGVRAVSRGKPISPAAVVAYLDARFGDDLTAVWDLFAQLLERHDVSARWAPTARWLAAARGVDVRYAFSEIPPE